MGEYKHNLKLTIQGRIPSKKNSKQIVVCRNRRFLIPSENHKLWEIEQSYKIKRFRPKQPIKKCYIKMFFYAPDKRTADLDNKSTTILDLLVKNGIILDDNWFVCKGLDLCCAGVDRDNPRAEIIIKY